MRTSLQKRTFFGKRTSLKDAIQRSHSGRPMVQLGVQLGNKKGEHLNCGIRLQRFALELVCQVVACDVRNGPESELQTFANGMLVCS